MCGIIGYVGQKEANGILLKGLKRLEYRGYDSCGMAIRNSQGVLLKKDIGNINKVDTKVNFSDMPGTLGISHTRWATNGRVTQLNAHPHHNTTKTIFAVHNGIIENYEEIKQILIGKGYQFITETDSEIIPFFFDDQLQQGHDMNTAITNFIQQIKGTFAILLLRKDEEKVYAIKRDSPLALGICQDKLILGSDIYAFSNETNQAIFFDDDEFAVLDLQGYRFFSKTGEQLEKNITEFEWTREDATKEQFDHYMIKEIKEQPVVSSRLITSFTTTQEQNVAKLAALIRQSKKIVFVACGTSYHASLVGAILLTKLGYNARSIIASELESFTSFDNETLAIAITQSGETMDVLTVLKNAKRQGAMIVSIVNVPFSTIQRLSDLSIDILAGQEICVASTKAFTNQVIVMLELARRLGYETHLPEIPQRIQQTITDNEEKIKQLAQQLYLKKDIFVLGKGLSYPMAREIALKLKEIPYVHAEGMMAGELKHGTIALIEEGTPVISLIPNNNQQMITAAKEVEARGANVISISNSPTTFNSEFVVPSSCDAEFAIYSGIIGHLLSYYIALLKGCEIDCPRNLAKSVTVE